jgi:hypothetical protein
MPKTKEQLEQSRVRRAEKLKRINEFRILQGNDPYRSYTAYLKNRVKPQRTPAQIAATERMIEARNLNNTKNLNNKDRQAYKNILSKKINDTVSNAENKRIAKKIISNTLKNKPTKEQIEYVESKFYRPLPPIPKAAKPLPAIPIKNKKVKVPLVIVEPPKQVMSEIHKKAVDEIIKKGKGYWGPKTQPMFPKNKKVEIIVKEKPISRKKKQEAVAKAKAEEKKVKKQERIKVIKAKIDAEKKAKQVVDKKVKVAKKKVKVAEKKVAVAEKKVQPINNKINGMNFVEFMMRNK